MSLTDFPLGPPGAGGAAAPVLNSCSNLLSHRPAWDNGCWAFTTYLLPNKLASPPAGSSSVHTVCLSGNSTIAKSTREEKTVLRSQDSDPCIETLQFNTRSQFHRQPLQWTHTGISNTGYLELRSQLPGSDFVSIECPAIENGKL